MLYLCQRMFIKCIISGALRPIEIVSFLLLGTQRLNVEQKVITSVFPPGYSATDFPPHIHKPKLRSPTLLPELPAISGCSSSPVASRQIQIRKTGSLFLLLPCFSSCMFFILQCTHSCLFEPCNSLQTP